MELKRVQAYRGEFLGWKDACFVTNGLVRLAAVPDIGGRIMGCALGPHEFFYVDPELAGKLFTPDEHQGDGSLGAWKNYGGDKTWPAPQGWERDDQWHGPPDPVLDSGPYTVDELAVGDGMARVRMTSAPDPRTGVQITRQFIVRDGSSRVFVSLTFRNTRAEPIRWAIWDVAQLAAHREADNGQLVYEPTAIVTAPLNPNSTFPRGFNVMFGAEDNPQWQANAQTGLFEAPYLWHIGKVGLDLAGPSGWIAFANPAAGFAFCETFSIDAGAEYPDQGVSAEVWTTGAGVVGNLDYSRQPVYLMETEALGPLRTIPPGGSSSLSIEWDLCRADGKVRGVNAGGAEIQPLRAQALQAGDWLRLTGTFGAFEHGDLWLHWLDEAGTALNAHHVGDCDPLTLVRLDRVFAAQPGAVRATLGVNDAADHFRTLGSVLLP
ncbi:MAG: DUF4380 domain-containing protein [Anaerolineae bacterium]|nr:DUF4380 domain-containing protein [Anaerolineae bacterium]